jgi:hypothetical protein
MKWNIKSNRGHSHLDGWYIITPEIAADIFANRAKNRPLKEHHAQVMAAEMRTKTYRPNGEPLIFNEDGELSDGQNRIRACIIANVPFETYCIFGIPKKYFPSFDQGKPRAGNDLAALMGFKSWNAVAATARLAIEYADGTIGRTGKGKFPNERLKVYLERNRSGLEEAVQYVQSFKKDLAGLVPVSHVSFLFYIVREKHPAKAEEFIEKLSSGDSLQRGSPILLLRERMRALVGRKHELDKAHKLVLLIKAWKAFIQGRSVGTLKWAAAEPFPRIEPADIREENQ